MAQAIKRSIKILRRYFAEQRNPTDSVNLLWCSPYLGLYIYSTNVRSRKNKCTCFKFDMLWNKEYNICYLKIQFENNSNISCSFWLPGAVAANSLSQKFKFSATLLLNSSSFHCVRLCELSHIDFHPRERHRFLITSF